MARTLGGADCGASSGAATVRLESSTHAVIHIAFLVMAAPDRSDLFKHTAAHAAPVLKGTGAGSPQAPALRRARFAAMPRALVRRGGYRSRFPAASRRATR